MPYESKAVANYFLEHAQKLADEQLTPMKLQKLIYYAHGWHIGLTDGEPLLDEQVQAWPYGPVVHSVYEEFREFGGDPITRKAMESYWDDYGECWLSYVPTLDKQVDGDPSAATITWTKQLLDRIWEVFGRFTAIQLSNMTHEKNGPWDRVKQDYNGRIPKYTTIPVEYLKDYFGRK